MWWTIQPESMGGDSSHRQRGDHYRRGAAPPDVHTLTIRRRARYRQRTGIAGRERCASRSMRELRRS